MNITVNARPNPKMHQVNDPTVKQLNIMKKHVVLEEGETEEVKEHVS